MGNMGYCRFRNTLGDLKVCKEHIEDDLDGEEFDARKRLIELCKRIAESYDADEFEEGIDVDD